MWRVFARFPFLIFMIESFVIHKKGSEESSNDIDFVIVYAFPNPLSSGIAISPSNDFYVSISCLVKYGKVNFHSRETYFGY
jgi:hypothetical protein